MTISRDVFVNIFFTTVIVTIYLSSQCYGFHLLETPETVSRVRRQSSCGSFRFRCDNGECISQEKLCDGVGDCSDGSDENLKCLDRAQTCPDFAFRCEYGACVDGDARCNTVKECFDNSDEAGCTNTNVGSCGTRFTCDSGQCIDRYLLCDGNRDCTDGSDETFKNCNTIPCQDYSYRCAYGACVDGDARCNGISECADGSDESAQICGESITTPPVATPLPPTNGCALPPQPDNGKYTIIGGNGPGVVNQIVGDYTTLKFECIDNYDRYPPNKLVYCEDNQWNLRFPQCLKTCPPRVSESVITVCELDGINKNCSERMIEGTKVSMKCKHLYFQLNDVNPVSICKDGSWDYGFIKCAPVCGKLIPEGTTLIVEGQLAKKGSFPWHVGIYRKTKADSFIKYKCGGSIISTNVVLSAAHCFTSNDLGEPYDKDEYHIAAGKYYSNFDEPLDNLAQKTQPKNIIIPPDYKGGASSYGSDIAIVILQSSFKITHVVQPVCVDWQNEFEDSQLRTLNKGIVAGWGLTVEDSKVASKELRQLEVPYLSRTDCYGVMPKAFYAYLTFDKFCAGYSNGSSVCKGDSGGGLVFYRPEGDKYYIRGLVSLGPVKEGTCDSKKYGAYTKISVFMTLIREIESTNRNYN